MVFICPSGFTCYVDNNRAKEIIFTGMRVKKHFNHKRIGTKVSNKNCPIIEESEFFDYLEEIFNIQDIFRAYKESKSFVSETLHEIRKLNNLIKLQSEQASRVVLSINKGEDITNCLKEGGKPVNPQDFLHYRVSNIFSTSSIISLRLDANDAALNPFMLEVGNKSKMEIHAKFHKVYQCMHGLFKQKHVTINQVGKCYCHINAYDIFEILPFLIYDNALKYSPNEKEITVKYDFDPRQQKLYIGVKSIGPKLDEQNFHAVFDKNYRGKNAERSKVTGSGIGLYLILTLLYIYYSTKCFSLIAVINMHNFDIHLSFSTNPAYPTGRVFFYW